MSKLPKRSGLFGKFWTFDSYVSSGLFETWDALKRWGSAYSSFLYRFRLAGLRRVFVGLIDDGLTLGVIFAFGLLAYALPPFSGTGDVWNRGREYAVTFTDTNGTVIGRRGIRQNDAIALEDIPPHAIKAVLATEDARFFDHFGVDLIGTLRAIVQNTRANATVQGGSSLTQQVAKNLFLSPERTIRRKIHEAFLSLWIEARLSKPEILKLYLDRSYMGGGAYGIEAASQFYFGKSVRDINLSEAAMLAGLFKAPTKYAPHQNIETARARANVVLYRMVAAGFISQGELLKARREPAHVAAQATTDSPDWFLDQAYRDTLAILDEEDLNKDFVIEVKTTVDMKLQTAAQKIINDVIDTRGPALKFTQAASVTMTPQGAVKAIVGGRDYEDSQFNRATSALRQTGSAFKPFVYLAALLDGFKPNQIVVDSPVSYGNWSPRNYTEKYAGRVTLSSALAHSYNSVPVKLMIAMHGLDKIVKTAHAVGIEGALDKWAPMVLGTSSLTLLDITRGYATFAAGGKLADPYTVLEIKRPNGDIIYDRFKTVGPAQQVVPEEAVADLNSMLKQVVKAGTARSADLGYAPQGGKTGTNQSYRDAWYIGFTAHNVTGVWVGNDDFSPMEKVTGGMVPAPTWKRIMNFAEQNELPQAVAGIPLDETYSKVADANFDDPALQAVSASAPVVAAVATTDDEAPAKLAEAGAGADISDKPDIVDVSAPAADDPLNNLFSLFEKKVPKPEKVQAPRKVKPKATVAKRRQPLQQRADLEEDNGGNVFEPLVLPRTNTQRRSNGSFIDGLFNRDPDKPRKKRKKKTLFDFN